MTNLVFWMTKRAKKSSSKCEDKLNLQHKEVTSTCCAQLIRSRALHISIFFLALSFLNDHTELIAVIFVQIRGMSYFSNLFSWLLLFVKVGLMLVGMLLVNGDGKEILFCSVDADKLFYTNEIGFFFVVGFAF